VPDEAPLEDEADDEEELDELDELDELEALEPEEPDEVELPEDEEGLAKLLTSPPPQADSSRNNGASNIHRRMRPLRRHCPQ
jgi:hypothetical protein